MSFDPYFVSKMKISLLLIKLLVPLFHCLQVCSVDVVQKSFLKGQYHAIFSNTLKIERRYSVDSSQDIMTKIPLKDYQNTKKLSTDVFAGR